MAFEGIDKPPRPTRTSVADHIRRGDEINVYCGNFRCIRNKPLRKGGKPNGVTLNLSRFDPGDDLASIKKRLRCSECRKFQASYSIGTRNAASDRPELYNLAGAPIVIPHQIRAHDKVSNDR